MDFIEKELLSEAIVPILLGYSPEVSETARRMYRRYNVISHVFCEPIPLPCRLSLSAKFHTVKHQTAGERLMLQALLDFAKQHENADLILYLVPCTERYASMLWTHREELEQYFVLADREELERVLFGASEVDVKEVKT